MILFVNTDMYRQLYKNKTIIINMHEIKVNGFTGLKVQFNWDDM